MASPLLARLLLLSPRRVEHTLEKLSAAGVVHRPPSPWQVTLGVLRMWHRIAFRPQTIGTCKTHTVRSTWRARLLAWRAVRLPCLLVEGAVAPWDLSGLLSSPEVLERHLLGAHHDGNQFVYDLEALSPYPERLAALEDAARAVVEVDDARSRWLRDLVVYEGYHEHLLEAVRAARAGTFGLSPAEAANPDITLSAYLRWCAAQPQTPAATWRAWRAGKLEFSPRHLVQEPA